jgi:hypothetical protein
MIRRQKRAAKARGRGLRRDERRRRELWRWLQSKSRALVSALRSRQERDLLDAIVHGRVMLVPPVPVHFDWMRDVDPALYQVRHDMVGRYLARSVQPFAIIAAVT